MTPSSSPTPALAELIAILGEDQARAVVHTFLQSFPSALHELTVGNRERAHRAAHSLKSSARQMGAEALAQQMAAIEERLSRPDGMFTPKDLAAMATKFSEAAGALRAFAETRP